MDDGIFGRHICDGGNGTDNGDGGGSGGCGCCDDGVDGGGHYMPIFIFFLPP